MCEIHIRVECSESVIDALVGSAKRTELAVESIVSTALLDVFDTVHVKDVTVLSPQNGMEEEEVESGVDGSIGE
ncbi:MAG TPA: hypothetical protein VFA41_18550 [Ktedonobacteraceae bacterium]|jgi:hypothetical protein|nr:hypothetical protein [Ktedonobacteraceae bacterium]